MATLGLVTLLPTAVLVVVAHNRTAAAIEESSNGTMVAFAERTAAQLDGLLVEKFDAIRGLSMLPAVQQLAVAQAPAPEARRAVGDLLENLRARDPEYTIACGVLDRSGHCLADARPLAVGGDEHAQEYFSKVMEGNGPWFGYSDWLDTPWPSLVFASPIRDGGGAVCGVLRLVLDCASVQNLLADSDGLTASSTLVLVDAAGRVVADARSPERCFGAARLPRPDEAGRPAAVRKLRWFPAEARRAVGGHAAAARVGELPLLLYFWEADSTYREPLDRLSHDTLLQGLAMILLLLLSAAVAATLLAGPIQRLEQAAQGIAEGSFDVPIPTGSGEIGSLGRSLLQMQERLLQTMTNLEETAANAHVASQAKSQFLANMSHELRTPMTAIIGYAEVLVDNPSLDVDGHDQAATVLRNARHLLDLVNEVLDLAKVEAGTMETHLVDFSPSDVLGEVIELLHIRARDKGIGLRLDSAGLPGRLRSDPHRLRQILLNLAGNAIKFTDSGCVALRARLQASPTRLVCEVIDTGCGIPPARLGELFRPFVQVDSSMSRRHGGTGLGLTISKRIANLLGGDITVASEAGQGSTFTLSLPVEIVTETAKEEGPPKPVPKKQIGGRILLVDDGRDNQRLFAYILEKAGAEVTVAENGFEGVVACSAAGDPLQGLADPLPFDLVLMDMQMPVLDGYTATRRLRDMGATIPIIALTAHAMGGARDDCIAAGCDDCATKPIGGPALIDVCEKWLARAAAPPD
ncbi:MAG: ATP-binding protein [Planctomycetota bacterium]